MLKTRTWIILFAVLLLLCLAALLLMPRLLPKDAAVVQILQDGKLLHEIDLNHVQQPRELTIADSHGGSNTVLVEPGRICITRADCPDQVCVRRGWLSPEQPAPIVCLPHRLVIQLAGSADIDSVSQ